MGIARFRRFDTADKMILSSTLLAILLFATPDADAQRCNRWKTCYEQIQQHENSALQQTVKAINRTLSTQIELLEHEKSEMNNTIFSQTERIQLLENMMNEQAKQISKLVETCSDSREMEQATEQKTLLRTTTTQISTTQIKKYKLKLVAKKLYWEAARQHCVNNFGGDLIQHDPRLYTREGRQEIFESLNLSFNTYHTGIKRDESNYRVWRRSSDGAEVQLEGWWPGYPLSNASFEFLYWWFYNDSDKNQIYNYPDLSRYFICEY